MVLLVVLVAARVVGLVVVRPPARGAGPVTGLGRVRRVSGPRAAGPGVRRGRSAGEPGTVVSSIGSM